MKTKCLTKPETDFILTLLIMCVVSSETRARAQHTVAIASERCLGSYSTGVFKQLFPSFIKTHYELSCNGELIFFDDLCIPVKIKVCLKAELERTEVGTY